MKNDLKSLYLQIDTNSQSLANNSLGQLIIKILYNEGNRLKIDELRSKVNNVFKTKLGIGKINNVLEGLVKENNVKLKKKDYYLSSSKIKKIKKAIDESDERTKRIISKYFSPISYSEETIKDWLTSISISFFNSYTADWISDLCYTTSNIIKRNHTNIADLIKSTSRKHTRILNEDIDELKSKFLTFISTNEPDVNSYLWEFGVSSFASTLVTSSLGADNLSVKAFSNSKCVLDTNILMNIGLEGSSFSESFEKIDITFSLLNIKAGYFYQTRDEYVNAISAKRGTVLNLFEKYSFDVFKEIDDDYIQSAISRKCTSLDDLVRFFDEVLDVPDYIHDKHLIEVFDTDVALERTIKEARESAEKKAELNDIFKQKSKREKSSNQLNHDSGLIAGTEYIRNEEKCFLLTQDFSINEYAKLKPNLKDLPFAIRLETLISMLALDSGGVDINPSDCSSLFATMIRSNLVPDKDIFKIEDLSKMLETEHQINQLPDEELLNIARSVHRNRCIGKSEAEISLDLSRQFQGSKLKLMDELNDNKNDLKLANNELSKQKDEIGLLRKSIKVKFENEEYEKIDRQIFKNKLFLYFLIPIGLLLLTAVGIYLYGSSNLDSLGKPDVFQSYIIGLAVSVTIWFITSFTISKPWITKKSISRQAMVESIVERRMSEEII
ncbi:MAG: hypothetical protein OCD01_09920 [Fibrobacterales bacterium]